MVFGALTIISGIMYVFFDSIIEPSREAHFFGWFMVILLLGGFIYVPVGIVFGIVAHIKIKKSNGRLIGQKLATLGISICIISVFIIPPLIVPTFGRPREYAYPLMCGSNLAGLRNAMLIYANEFDEKYPTPDKWCDLLKYYDVPEKNFKCPANNEARCSYAINPNCEPNSPPDTVLLFESKGGWNQSGGPELLTLENHKWERCNILFNDGSVKPVKTEQIAELKWGAEPKQ
jgi:prepilin-type processing-associated H-X9-DG protein